MRYIISYDIADDKRRYRVAEALKDYGSRLEESLFEAALDEELAERLRARLRGLIEEAVDVVHVFALCAGCEKRTEVMGRGRWEEERLWHVL